MKHPLARIRERAVPSLTGLCKTGGWFCQREQRFVNLGLDHDSPAKCPNCHKRTAVWVPPVNNLYETQSHPRITSPGVAA